MIYHVIYWTIQSTINRMTQLIKKIISSMILDVMPSPRWFIKWFRNSTDLYFFTWNWRFNKRYSMSYLINGWMNDSIYGRFDEWFNACFDDAWFYEWLNMRFHKHFLRLKSRYYFLSKNMALNLARFHVIDA